MREAVFDVVAVVALALALGALAEVYVLGRKVGRDD